MSSQLNPKQKTKLRNLFKNYPYFARNFLNIKPKSGLMKKFIFNEAQWKIHKAAEDQLRRTGKIRLIILKPRQVGTSTYIQGRIYHKTAYNPGQSGFILTHKDGATNNLFNMAKRFHKSVPSEIRPEIQKSNSKELVFAELDGGYRVGTAGSADVGRSDTLQYFHGSEVAFWKNTDSIMTGVLEAVADLPGTEIYLESTANGLGNMFHKEVQKAIAGESEYELVFIPWFDIDEYEDAPPADFVPTESENEIIDLYLQHLPKERQIGKLSWRRRKIQKLDGLWKFKQEYPSNADEAFQTSGNSLVKAEDIMRARQCNAKDPHAPLVFGVDPARDGDRSTIVFRRGREVPIYYKFEEMDSMRLAGILGRLIDRHKPVMVNCDTAYGWGTIDRLIEMGYDEYCQINGIHFNNSAVENDVYINIRAEMWCNVRDWLKRADINIPDENELHSDLTAVPDIRHTSDSLIKLISKDKIIEDYGRSPDLGDGLALTLALPVKNTRPKTHQRIEKPKGSPAPWKNRQRNQRR